MAHYQKKFLLLFVGPFLLTALLYRHQAIGSNAIRNFFNVPVRVVEPWAFDWTYFGVATAAHGRLTPSEWWRLHTHPLLDLISGLFYLLFIFLFVLIAARFWWEAKHEKQKHRRDILQSASLGFLLLNILGYITYSLYPAAPPWYTELKGLSTLDWSTPAHAAGAQAFDALLGVQVFAKMYGMSAAVFGAVPSLHVAYPALALTLAWRGGVWRLPTWLYFLGMSFSAVYLNHHYVFDIIWGTLYGLAVGLTCERILASMASLFRRKE